MLEQVDVDRRQVEALVQHAIGFYNEVGVGVAFYGYASLVEGIFGVAFRVAGGHFQRIFQRNGVEDCFQVVIAVGAFFGNVQSQVYFSIRKGYHSQ